MNKEIKTNQLESVSVQASYQGCILRKTLRMAITPIKGKETQMTWEDHPILWLPPAFTRYQVLHNGIQPKKINTSSSHQNKTISPLPAV
jgi:hypothetical protein